MMIARRSILTGLMALVAAPAIVRAGSLMQVNSGLVPSNTLLTIDQIMREAVQRFQDSNLWVEQMNIELRRDLVFMEGEQWDKTELERCSGHQYDNMFAADNAKIGDVLRIRMPNDWLTKQQVLDRWPNPTPQVPDSLALTAAVVAIAPVVFAKPVTRRFWAK